MSVGVKILEKCRSSLYEAERRALQSIAEIAENEQRFVMRERVSRHVNYNSNKIRNRAVRIDDEIGRRPDATVGIREGEAFKFDEFKRIQNILVGLQSRPKCDRSAQNVARCLVLAKNENKFSSGPLGTLDKCIHSNTVQENRLVFDHCKQEYASGRSESLKHGIKEFILEVGKTVKPEYENIAKYYKKYQTFMKDVETTLNLSLGQFMEQLSKPEFKAECQLWCKSIENESLKIQADEAIAKNPRLKQYEDVFYKALLMEFDWDACCKDKDLVKQFKNFIREQGALSYCYREMLAHIYDVNIRCYEEKNKLYQAIADHHPDSDRVIYLLRKDNCFTEMQVDEDYLKLKQERREAGDRYARILADVERLEEEHKIRDYVETKQFLTLDNDTEKKQETLLENTSTDEGNIIREILHHFSPNEKVYLKERLEKMRTVYLRNSNILYFLKERFAIEGAQLTCQELCCFINAVLASGVEEGSHELNMFCWIIVSRDQKNWVDEVLLLRLQNYYRETLEARLPTWRNLLSKVGDKIVLLLFLSKLDQHKSVFVSIEGVSEILEYLSVTPSLVFYHLERLGLSEWPYVLQEQYLSHRLSSEFQLKTTQLASAIFYFLHMENSRGLFFASSFLNVLKKKMITPDMLIKTLSIIHDNELDLSIDHLLRLADVDIEVWIQEMQSRCSRTKIDRKAGELISIMRKDENNSPRILERLDEVAESIRESEAEFDKFSVTNLALRKATYFHSYICNLTHKTDANLLTAIVKAIDVQKRFVLRDTQKIAILTFLANPKNTLAQISTGEGKTLIIVAMAIVKAMRGERVDIVTSSSVLARRDAAENSAIYSLFKISVADNCSEDMEMRKKAYSNNQVIYSDLSNLQRDYLLDKFYDKNILGDRVFENMYVDEVDSMLVDKGNNMLYLSHDIAGFDKLEPVYIFIWQWMNRPAKSELEISHAFDVQAIADAVLYDMYGMIKRKDLKCIDPALNDNQINMLWSYLIEYNVLDSGGKFLQEIIHEDDIEDGLPSELAGYATRLCFFLRQHIHRKRYIHVPNYLKSFVEKHLKSWIRSAQTALLMQENQDHVIDIDRTFTSPDRNANVTILDRSTGTDQANSQWDEALHQFLQLKYGCKMSLQSLKSIFISNVSFFKLYKKMYGLTGTLGSHSERELLKTIHEVDFVTIPTAKAKQFRLKPTILCATKKDWIQNIISEAETVTMKEKRSILIICDTMKDVELLSKKFQAGDTSNVHTYTRDYEEFAIADNLKPGDIIIATNLAGRGTDIKLSDTLRENGGLHVCLAYHPDNGRIAEQAFGRAARCGDLGTGRYIVMIPEECENKDNITMPKLEKERDIKELQRLSDVKSYYEVQIVAEENYFKMFKEAYEHIKELLKDAKPAVEVEARKILLDSCLYRWALWLDSNSSYINEIADDECKKRMDNSIADLILQFKQLRVDDWMPWLQHNPIQMIKFGTYLGKQLKYDSAMLLFDSVIESEPYFSESAHYYKAFVLGSVVDWTKEPKDKKNIRLMKRELLSASRLFSEHSRRCLVSASIIGKIKQSNPESVIQINSYEEQRKTVCKLYSALLQSIDDILGGRIDETTFVDSVNDEDSAKMLYKDLLAQGLLKRPKVKRGISEDPVSREHIKAISFDYGISHTALSELLENLEGQKVEAEILQSALEGYLKLPSKELFWTSLRRSDMFNDEALYVIIDNDDIAKFFGGISDELLAESCQCKTELESQILEQNQLVFNTAVLEDNLLTDSACILKESTLRSRVSARKYEALESNGVFSFNKRATLIIDKCKTNSLPFYDFIKIEDFAKVDINTSDAERILEILTEQRIIAIDNSETDLYRLAVEYEKIPSITIPFCPAYEATVKALLTVKFTYRIALQKIVKQLEQGNRDIKIHLLSSPHQILYWELLERRIIRPVTLADQGDDLKETLVAMYSRELEKQSIFNMLSRNNLILAAEDQEALFDRLIESDWIETAVGQVTKYKINSLSNRRPLTAYEDLEEIIADIFKTHSTLSKSTTHNHSKLSELGRASRKFKRRVFELVDLSDFCGKALHASGELQIFALNSLDQILHVNYKRPSVTIFTITLGTCEVIFGFALSLYEQAKMGRVANGLIQEGLNDVMYGFTRKDPTWNDYIQYKMSNMALAYANYGVGAQFQDANGVSNFGLQVVMRIVDAVEAKLIHRQVSGGPARERELVQGMIMRASEGLVSSTLYSGIDTLVDNHLRNLCNEISSMVSNHIKEALLSHDVHGLLINWHQSLGEQKVRQITLRFLDNREHVIGFISVGDCIVRDLSGRVQQTIKRIRKSDQHRANVKELFKDMAPLDEHAKRITEVTGKILDNLRGEFAVTIASNSSDTEFDLSDAAETVTDNWRQLFLEQFEKIVQPYVTSPLRTEIGDLIARHFEKDLSKNYQSYKCNGYAEYFDRLKRNYHETHLRATDEAGRRTQELTLRGVITQTYYEELQRLLDKIRSVQLFSEMIMENAPMRSVYAQLYAHAIPQALNLTDGFIIIAEAEDGTKLEFSSVTDGSRSDSLIIVYIGLRNGCFRLHGDSSGIDSSTCLYEALKEHTNIDESPRDISERLVNTLDTDRELQMVLEKIWDKNDGRNHSDDSTSETDIFDPTSLRNDFRKVIAETLPRYEDDVTGEVEAAAIVAYSVPEYSLADSFEHVPVNDL